MRVLVLGGGPAGAAAAMQARELGAAVTLVESSRVGGTNLNEGPAPVRTLARAARLMRDTRSWERFGLRGDPPQVDLAAAIANAQRVADYGHEQRRLDEFLRNRGIELIEGAGPALFQDAHTVRLSDGRMFSGEAIVVSVGGHAGSLPISGAELALTYRDILQLTELPRSVAVVGGADTGCQLASILADFGASVTLIEADSRLVPTADIDISTILTKAFIGRGIAVLTETFVERLDRASGGITVGYRRGAVRAEVTVDAVFFAVGWPGNAESIGAEEVGIQTRGGYVTVTDDLRSNLPHVFAAGDVNGISMLVPSARSQGRIAAENAVLGTRRRFSRDAIPIGSFTDPEYGSVGVTEAEAREQYECDIAVMRYDDLLRPVADGRPDGLCKLIVERHHRYILGAHVIGEYSAEVIQMVAACMSANMRIEEVADLQPAFPTFTEAIVMAAQKIVGQLGIAPLAPSWSDLRRGEAAPVPEGSTEVQHG